MSQKFDLISENKPTGDQPEAIAKLVEGFQRGDRFQTLMGVTGSGKTFTMAHTIAQINKPTLVLSHNKTLAAQLYREFKELFPQNAVEYFVSYYDYYQPEAYIPSTDTYIEKDSSINDEIDRLRLSATASLLDRKDVLIVSTVSCIFGLGSPEDYRNFVYFFKVGMEVNRNQFLKRLVEMRYERNDVDFSRSTFRVRGDVVEILPAYTRDTIRVEFFGDEIERITTLEPISGKLLEEHDRIILYPAKHFLTSKDRLDRALKLIMEEMTEQVARLNEAGKEFEAHRLYTRTTYDMELLREIGYCNGIENYSRHLAGREPGSRPFCLLDYFPSDYLLFVDESHVTIPQIHGMYNGDRSRKMTLVDHGFRLPSALDNRPLKYEEFYKMINQATFVSATPGTYEIEQSTQVVEQIIRPTGLLDPEISIRQAEGQIDDLIGEVKDRVAVGERTLVTTMTKKMSEDLATYLSESGIQVRYLHSEVETVERVEILRDLRKGEFDCLVGVNLLREGIDLPEVSLVIILDADKIGFLRSFRSLIQISGRAARHIHGKVIMYGDRISDAMKQTVEETERRRQVQMEYNKKHNITPKSIQKNITDILERKYATLDQEAETEKVQLESIREKYNFKLLEDRQAYLKEIENNMFRFAENLEFEKAAQMRDELDEFPKRYPPKG
jgi:excinuclease ABC subunit B